MQSGGEASLVTKVVDVVNGTEPSQSLRDPPVITISKSGVAVVYALNYLMVTPFAMTVLRLFLNLSPFPHQTHPHPLCYSDLFLSLSFASQDAAYKPEEHFVETRKCEPDAGADVVGYCER